MRARSDGGRKGAERDRTELGSGRSPWEGEGAWWVLRGQEGSQQVS